MAARVQDDPDRRCFKVEEWPELDRQLWRESLRQGELFDEDGAAAHWSPATREKYRKGYGRWLNWLRTGGEFDPGQLPGERATRERVARYASALATSVAPNTRRGRLRELLAVVGIMAPAEDWSWLRRAIATIDHGNVEGRDKRGRLQPSRNMFETALKALRGMDAEISAPDARSAVGYRDSLIVAFLVARPLRRSNMAAIRIGTHLIPIGGGYKLVFEARST